MRLEDANSWLQSTGVSLLQDLAILPFTTALAMGTIALLALCSQRVKKKIESRWLEGKDVPEPELQEPAPEPGEVVVEVRHFAGPKSGKLQAEEITPEQLHAVLPGVPDSEAGFPRRRRSRAEA